MAADESHDDKTQSFIALTSGTSVLHYKILEKIGAGGMGEVYLAEDTELDRKVALKFLPSHLCQDEECRARFKREAQAVAKLNHPNIVTIHEVGEFNGRPFFAIEHVPGETLRAVIKQGKVTSDEAVNLAMQVCEGLHEAHSAGVVHRDIKPANIIIDTKGRARILDFGLAMVSGEDKLTKTGSTLGTVGYMAPEQISGKNVDHRADLFSVGVILYEMLTGRKPFEGDNDAAVVKAITDSTPEPIARFKSGVTGELQQVINNALTKDPALRYQHADGMLADLRRLASVDSAPEVRKGRVRVVAPLLIILVLIVTALILRPWRFEVSSVQESQTATDWLAVMYFDNVAEPSDSKRLGEIATNLLITGLSQSEYLRVMSSQRLYDLLRQVGKEGAKTIDRATASQIAKRAEAQWMLTGSILQSEPVLVLTSQLIDVSSGGVIASQRITGKQGEDIFAVIDRLTESVKMSSSLPSAMTSEPSVNVAEVTTHSQEAYQYYLEGLEYYNKLYYPETRRSFLKAIELDSTFASAYLWLSKSGAVNSRQEGLAAIAKAEQYSDRTSDRERRLIRIESLSYDDVVDFQVVLEELRQYLDRYPDDKESWMTYANWYWTCFGNADSAVAFMNRAIALDPAFKLAYNSIAYLCGGNLRQYDKAFAAVDKYIDLAPNEPNPYDSRGDLYAFSGQLDSAIAWYQKALSIKPDYYSTIRKLGHMYLFAGQYLQAESLYQARVTTFAKPERGHARSWLVYTEGFQGKLKKALRLADDCITANKLDDVEYENAGFYIKKSEIFDFLGMWDSVASNVRIIEKLSEELGSDDFFMHRTDLIRWHYRSGDTASAARLLELVSAPSNLRFRGGAHEYWCAMGEIAIARAEYPRAIEYFNRADSQLFYYTRPKLYYRLGEAYWESDDAPSAISTLEKFLKSYYPFTMNSPFIYATAHYLLGRAYEAEGDKVKAQSYYEEFLNIWKDADPGIKEVEDAEVRLAKLKHGP